MSDILTCIRCERESGDIEENRAAWDGWLIEPYILCPECIKEPKVIEEWLRKINKWLEEAGAEKSAPEGKATT